MQNAIPPQAKRYMCIPILKIDSWKIGGSPRARTHQCYRILKLIGFALQVARQGRAVIMSLHQPSPDMFRLLDTAMLLAAGQRVYFGPTANVGAVLSRHYGFPCPPGKPAAEHMLEVRPWARVWVWVDCVNVAATASRDR